MYDIPPKAIIGLQGPVTASLQVDRIIGQPAVDDFDYSSALPSLLYIFSQRSRLQHYLSPYVLQDKTTRFM